LTANESFMNLLTLKAFFGLAAFDLLGLDRNFARLHATVRDSKVASREVPQNITDLVCDAINRVCVWYPKRVLCLQRSAVTTRLLRSLGVSAYMVLGAQKLPFKAHAWVEVDGKAINERTDVKTIYAVWERC
jgi:hypothetical protein